MEVFSKGSDFWFFVLLVTSLCTVQVQSELDSSGFINIDCGIAANSSFHDTYTKLTFISDDQFIDTGVNRRIAASYNSNVLFEQFLTVRSFPSGTRNCYTLRSLSKGLKYLVRGSFLYGNYDNLNKFPKFDVYLGVNYWDTIEITSEDEAFFTEIITATTSDYLQVCLVNKNLGTPFISVLELRPLQEKLYEDANSTQSLVSMTRWNLGASTQLRYPDDPYDRIWDYHTSKDWTNISTSSTLEPDAEYATPSLVMQTAATTSRSNQSIDIFWKSDNRSTVFLIILHLREIQEIPSTAYREIDVFANGQKVYQDSLIPGTSYSGHASYMHKKYNDYNVSLRASSKSTLPPLLNAFERYVVMPTTGITTYSGDVTAMNTIKVNYKVNKDWSGDPCAPIEFSWTGVTCNFDSMNLRITTLNLSSSGLKGTIISPFGNLTALKSLDLSNNDLSGSIPTYFDKLSALTYVDITGNNKISTTLPPGLASKIQEGKIVFRIDQKDTKNKSSVVIASVVAGVVVLLLITAAIIIVVCLRRPKRYGKISPPEVMINLENRPFSYNDLVKITNNFQNNIGTGGFGSVFVGTLEDGTRVAVKMRSHSSSQGVKEFMAEAQNLSTVHHKNLVSLIGYCMDGDCMALVYEFMQEGTLQDKLRDDTRPLSWRQRLRIAYESALGLEYLHKACNPPLIHRDVKTNNILLNENLGARIADFGLSRAFDNSAGSHVSNVTVVGTRGYLDPEYHNTGHLSEKSDVFSFGVVLLEIITGRSPIISGPEGGHLKQWVNQRLSRGDIESIADPRMNGYYDINSVWKVTELAHKCTENSPAQRPTMDIVVNELKESMDLELAAAGIHSAQV